MAKTKLPDGFPTWHSFWDYLCAEKPELLKAQTIRFMRYTPDGAVEAYKISLRTIKQKCWEEIQQHRLTIKEVMVIKMSMLQWGMCVDDRNQIVNKLDKLRKQGNSAWRSHLEKNR